MAKRGRHPHSCRPRGMLGKHIRQARPAAAHRRGPGDLLADVRQRLQGGEPAGFLAYGSTLLAALTRVGRRRSSATAVGRSAPRCPCLVESFAGVVLPETTALLAALAELGPDEVTRARARRVVAARPHPLPEWLAPPGGAPGGRGGGGAAGPGEAGEGLLVG